MRNRLSATLRSGEKVPPTPRGAWGGTGCRGSIKSTYVCAEQST